MYIWIFLKWSNISWMVHRIECSEEDRAGTLHRLERHLIDRNERERESERSAFPSRSSILDQIEKSRHSSFDRSMLRGSVWVWWYHYSSLSLFRVSPSCSRYPTDSASIALLHNDIDRSIDRIHVNVFALIDIEKKKVDLTSMITSVIIKSDYVRSAMFSLDTLSQVSYIVHQWNRVIDNRTKKRAGICRAPRTWT